ncbi:MAG: DUF4375 domain-containing protein [Clostridia bacterium]|nr:DUF4375 domain-containing protein [Clostridia bacterium]
MNFFQRIKFRRQIKKHINRPLDINEILSRESDTNIVVDAYEFFMRKYHWEIDECSSACVKVFLLCVLYDGEIANGGISQFLANSSGNYAHQTADALHLIGALDAETLLRKSFVYFKNGLVPEDETARNKMLDEFIETDRMLELDADAYNTDVFSFCYQYLIKNKSQILTAE